MVFCAGAITGCATDDATYGSDTQSVVINNKLSSNKLSSNKLSSNKLSSNKLSSNKLSSNRLVLDAHGAGDLIETDDGREVLTYIIGCAVEEGITLVGTDSHGTTYEFFGELGLAPDWLHHALTRRGSRWVSACLFARVNGHDVAVPVSLRGPTHALSTTPDEVANWTLQEGAYFGQYFTPDSQPIAWYACSGRDLEAAEAVQRECAQPDPMRPGLTMCGFNYAGDCGDYTPPPNRTACRRESSKGYFLDCATSAVFGDHRHHHDDDDDFDGDDDDHDHGHGHGHDHDVREFRQVITTYAHP